MKVKDLAYKYATKKIECDKKEKVLHDTIESCKKQLKELESERYSWVDFCNDAMALVAKKLDLKLDECRVTFGMRAECPIFLLDKTTGKEVYGITFLPPIENHKIRIDNPYIHGIMEVMFHKLTEDYLIKILNHLKEDREKALKQFDSTRM